jgi:hypothetical protein
MLKSIAVAFFCSSAVALAADETFRDLSTKEALYISDGPKVAYRGPRGGDPKPLTLLAHEDNDHVLKIRFKKSPQVWTLTISADRQKLLCEATGEPRQNFELMTPEKLASLAEAQQKTAGDRFVRIVSHEDGGASYEPVVEIAGVVGAGAHEITVASYDERERLRGKHKLEKFKTGDTSFMFRASKEIGNIGLGSNHFVIEAKFDEGLIAKADLHLSLHEYSGEMAKPVIYLYPRATQPVSVRVSPVGGVVKSAPAYGEGWAVTAHPDGKIVAADGSVHPYLFWESGLTEAPAPLTEGFVVRREALRGFLDERLTMLGLNAAEIADFEEFWLPKMSARAFAAIRFVPREEIDAAAPLDVKPRPDSVIRVLIDFRSLDVAPKLRAQKLAPAARRGFAVVEWGGLLYRE